MPFKSEKIHIDGTQYDRRKKLNEEEKEEVRRLYPQIQSQRKLAEMFGVSRRLITFILDPVKEIDNKRRQKEKKVTGYVRYSKQQWAATMRDHRRYKQNLYVNGVI